MVDVAATRVEAIRRATPDWTRIAIRLAVAALVAKPAVSKFLTYGNSVAFFDAIGMPAPTLLVIVAGLIEVGAVLLLLAGFGERLAALSLVPVMLVAMLYVGPDWKNLSVLIGSLAIVVLEPESGAVSWPARELLE